MEEDGFNIDVSGLLKDIRLAMPLKERRVGPIKFKQTFSGKDLVNYLTNTKNLSLKEANRIGDILLSTGVFCHCSSDMLPFTTFCWYTFAEQPAPPITALQKTSSKDRILLRRYSSLSTIVSEDRVQGWVDRKTKGAVKGYWFEIEEGNEIVSYYLDQPSPGAPAQLAGTINLSDADINAVAKPGKYKLVISEKKKKKHALYFKSEEDKAFWLERLNNIKEVDKRNKELLAQLDKDNCKRCITGDEEEVLTERNYEPIEDFMTITVEDYNSKPRSVADIVGGKTTVFVMLRHFGCLLCRKDAAKVLAVRNKFEALGIQVVAIGTGAPQIAKDFALECSFPGTIFCDPKRALYQSFGCKYGAKYLLNGKAIEKIQLASSEGFIQNDKVTRAHGVHRQIGGAVAIHAKHGIIYRHIDKFLGDSVNLDELLAVLRRFCEENPEDNWTTTMLYRNWNEFQNPTPSKQMAGGDPGHNYEYGINKIYNPPLSILDNITFYSTYFAIPGTQHDNFVSSHEKFGPILVSLENCQGDRRALIWTKKGIRRINVPGYEYNTVEQACNYLLEKLFGTTKDIPLLKLKDNIVSDLVELEKQCFFVNYKFGVLLARPGKISEDEMYDNSEMSPDFEEFLSFLGDKIALKGWKGFRGGLDVELDKTGEYSYYTMFDSDIQIMFHVCPLIPYIPDDPSRKRYIGNDVVVIIFKEGENDVFNPAIMRSQFNYVFLVVEKVPQTEGTTKYRIQFCSRPGVPPFPPYLNDPPVFEKTPEFRQFLLTKLINGERATISSAKDFAQKMDRTRNQLLETLIEKYKAPKKKK